MFWRFILRILLICLVPSVWWHDAAHRSILSSSDSWDHATYWRANPGLVLCGIGTEDNFSNLSFWGLKVFIDPKEIAKAQLNPVSTQLLKRPAKVPQPCPRYPLPTLSMVCWEDKDKPCQRWSALPMYRVKCQHLGATAPRLSLPEKLLDKSPSCLLSPADLAVTKKMKFSFHRRSRAI